MSGISKKFELRLAVKGRCGIGLDKKTYEKHSFFNKVVPSVVELKRLTVVDGTRDQNMGRETNEPLQSNQQGRLGNVDINQPRESSCLC